MKNKFKLIRLILLIGLAMNFAVTNSGTQKRVADNNPPAAEAWYLPTEDKAAHLYIYEVGKGEPVIVLHGGPGAGHIYMLNAAEGLENQFRFIFYDQRGAGLSFCAKEAISMEKNVQDLETLRKALGLEKLNLMSHSAGTMLAMNYLQTFPQNVKNLVLLGALDPKNGSASHFSPEELALFEQRNAEFERFQQRPEVQAEIKKAGLNQPAKTAKQEARLRHLKMAAANIYHIERWRQVRFFLVNRDAARATQSSTNFMYDWSKVLASHPYPITVINGEYDYVVGPKGSPIWKRVCATEARNVDLVLIEKAGHLAWTDDPIVFRNAVRRALTRTKLNNS